MREILKVRPDAIFVQSEYSGYNHAENPKAIAPAESLNERRFLSLDLNYGKRVNSQMYRFLLENGMTEDEYAFFMSEHLKSHCIMGNDYYEQNEHYVDENGRTSSSGGAPSASNATRFSLRSLTLRGRAMMLMTIVASPLRD